MAGQLAGLIRSKYPGQYDDMDDDTLERAITTKYPGQYDDLVTPPVRAVQSNDFQNAIQQHQATPSLAQQRNQLQAANETPLQEPTTFWGGFGAGLSKEIGQPETSALGKLIPENERGLKSIASRAYGKPYDEFLDKPLAWEDKSEPTSWLRGFEKGIYNELIRPMSSPANIVAELVTGGLIKKGLKPTKISDVGDSSEVVTRTIQRPSGETKVTGPQSVVDRTLAKTYGPVITPEQQKTRLRELIEKEDAGILTENELLEAQQLDEALDLGLMPKPPEPNLDPNFQGGMGDPELAGTQPYPPTIPPREGIGGDLHPETSIDDASYLASQSWLPDDSPAGPPIARGALDDIVNSITGKSAKNITPPKAVFHSIDESGQPKFDIRGGPSDGSTLPASDLQRMGIAVPEVPAGAAPIRGSVLRQQLMDARNKGFRGTTPEELQQFQSSIEPETGLTVRPPKGTQTVVDSGAPNRMAEYALEAADDMERAGDILGASRQRETVRRLLTEEPGISPVIPKSTRPNHIRQTGLNHIAKDIADPSTGQKLLTDDIEPSFMRVKGKRGELDNIAMGGASPKVLKTLGTSLYSGERPKIVVKELLQNSFDEHRNKGVTEPVKVLFDYASEHPQTGDKTHSVTVRDRGAGLTPDELYTKFTDVGETGKADQIDSSGGFGFAKAAPMLTGKYVKVESIVSERGKNIKYTFEGNPNELLDQIKGVGLKGEVTDLPTGLVVTTHFGDDVYFSNAKRYVKNMTENSPSVTSPVKVLETYDAGDNGIKIKDEFLHKDEMTSYLKGTGETYTKQPPKKLQDTIEIPGAKINIHYDDVIGDVEATNYNLHTSNKGLYQATNEQSYGSMSGIAKAPKDIVADIIATVEEGSDDYPFTLNREQLDAKIDSAIRGWIDKNIVSGAMEKRLQNLRDNYAAMTEFPRYDAVTKRPSVLYDPGNRLTPEEVTFLQKSPVMNKIMQSMDDMMDNILESTENTAWANKVEKVGLVFDDKMYGVHIPNPDKGGKSAILINPFEHMIRTENPKMASLETIITGQHEAGHVGSESRGMTLKVKDVDDPRMGRYFQSYLDQVNDHGGLPGHAIDFVKRLGEVYTRYGARKTFDAADTLEGIITDKSGGYSTEIQEILRIYKDSRGRPETSTDFLSGTGVKSKTPEGGKGTIPPDNKPNGKGVSRSVVTPKTASSLKMGTVVVIKADKASPIKVKQAREAGFEYEGLNDNGDFRFKKTSEGGKPESILESEVGQTRPTRAGARQQLGALTNVKKTSIASEAFSLPRALMASWDASAPFRQGLGLIHKPAFWKALGPMMKAWGSENAFQIMQAEIANRPLFKARVGKVNRITGKPAVLPSFAEDAGLKLMDLLNKREEILMNTWAEKVPGVRPSNRAYTIFLNKLRADVFEDLVKQGKVFGAGPDVNIPLARSLAQFVNIATGRGPLGKLEPAANILNQFLFSPRLMASRLKMMDIRLYTTGPPQVRKEALKSLFAIAVAGNVVTQLGKIAGEILGADVDVSNDPASSDYGKLRIGNTRVDTYGGHQQYIVAANRLLRPPESWGGTVPGLEDFKTDFVPIDNFMGMLGGKGQEIHSTTNTNEYDLWKDNPGPYDPNWLSVLGRFGRGKANPVLGFAISLASGKTELTGEDMNLTTMNPFENSIAQRFIPILMQDLYELSQTDEIPPEVKVLLAGASALGVGSQTYDGNQVSN